MVGLEEAKVYQAFYTKSVPIVKRMVENLNIKPTDLIFEPCGGEGVFVDEIIKKNKEQRIEVNELNPESIFFLKKKYSTYQNIQVNHSDTLTDTKFCLAKFWGGAFDKIIANPPYGAWQDYSKRKGLKKLYKGIYVKESYTLFLYHCIQLLKDKGTLSFIIPDTYLNLHMHKHIRKYILENTKIKEILLFPSKFFPGVNFGYANLSIITLDKCISLNECLNNKVSIINKFNKVEDLLNLNLHFLQKQSKSQFDILKNSDYAFLINDTKILSIIQDTKLKIGDIASCATGFYSGNDKLFIKAANNTVKNSKNYKTILASEIVSDMKNIGLYGISSKPQFIPIVKGGNTRYIKPNNWFLDWSEAAVKHYKTNKKSRFQNSSYYFKLGIGVPMVSASRITASLIQRKIFDQSIVGIFPHDEKFLYYLLGFFNSNTCNLLIRTINPSANNPSNYIRKIPFIEPNEIQLETVNNIVKNILENINSNGAYNKELDTKIDIVFKDIYSI